MAEDNGAQSLYVVQRLLDDRDDEWQDVTTIKVPPRTRRRTILEQALGTQPLAGAYRVLDAESAMVMQAELEEQPPKLVVR